MRLVELMSMIGTLRYALSGNDFVAEFSRFCFTGTHVYSWNGSIGIRMPTTIPIKGGIDGGLLAKLLSTCEGKDVTVVQKDTHVIIEDDLGHKFELELLNAKHYKYVFPEMPEDTPGYSINSSVVDAIRLCAITLDPTCTHQELRTVILDMGIAPQACSCDNYAISDVQILDTEGCGTEEKRIFFSHSFCKVFLNVAPRYIDGETIKLYHFVSGKQHNLLARIGDVDVHGMYPQIIDAGKVKFREMAADSLSDKEVKLVPIPAGFKSMMDSAVIFKSAFGTIATTLLRIKNNRLTVSTRTQKSQGSQQTFALDGEHEDIQVTVDPDIVRRVLDDTTKFQIFPQCTVFTNDDGAYTYTMGNN